MVSVTDYGAFIELEEGVEGLVHISEMSWTKRVKHPSKVVTVGDMVEAMVLDVDVENKRISLGMKQVEPNPWSQLADRYPVGSVIEGKVRNITDFGIFVGIEEGIDGLVHISDLSWTQRVNHPSELFHKGDDVKAMVLNIDADNERFSLGVKQLEADPWTWIPTKYPRGSKLKGKIVKLADFGDFIEIEPGIEGLVHISEISEDRIDDPGDVLKEGEEIEAVVINVDPIERKMGLSIRAIDAGMGEDYAEYMAPASGTARLGDILGDKFKDLQDNEEA